MKATYSQE